MHDSCRSLLSCLVAVLFPLSVLASVEPVIQLNGTLESRPGLGKGTPPTFLLQLEATRPLNLVVEARMGEAFEILVAEIPLALVDGDRLEVPIELHPLAEVRGRTGNGLSWTLQVRAIHETDVAHVQHFYFVDSPSGWRQLTADEHHQIIAQAAVDDASARARYRAGELIEIEKGWGNRPVRSPDAGARLEDDPSVAQESWDQLVEAEALQPIDPDPCNRFNPQGNSTYRVTGQVKFRDDYYSPGQVRSLSAGYPVVVVTQVRYASICGDVYYASQNHSGTTSSGGSFDVTVTSHVAPGGAEPVVSFRTTAPEAGLAQCGLLSCGVYPVEQSLSGGFSGVWSGGNRVISPVFTASSSPYPFFFRWNEEIKSLKSRWSAAGFGASFTPFTASYISTANPPVFFSPSGNGLVVYDSANVWRDKWTMAHEFGHQFQYSLQGKQLGGGGPHTVCQAVNDGVGFVEGFADWHGNHWETEGRSLFFSCANGECWSTCLPGYRRESNVMAFFWDIFDTRNDGAHDQGVDVVAYGLSLLKSWTNYTSFPAFYNDYTNRGLWGSGAGTVATLRSVNQLTVAQ